MPDAYYLTEPEIANVAAHIRSLAKLREEIPAGNVERGSAIFVRAGCFACHIYNGQGVGYGPELTSIGERRGVAFLKGVLKDPASELPEGFLLVTAVTMSGKPVTGIRTNEDTFTIQIRDNGGKLYSFRKNNLKQLTRQNGKTPMPSYRFSPSELQDLVSFLASSRRSP
jgi:putative heme-binding domain-containing protein